MTRVKICGITRGDDAVAAAALGAWAIGFVFWPQSPRAADPDEARRIAAALPPFVTPVGVFVNERPAEMLRIARHVRLGAFQLHGDEGPAILDALDRPVIRAISLVGEDVTAEWDRALLLVDAHDPVRRGGTGRTADWTGAARLARQRPIVLAGGLKPETIADAVRTVRPAGVDVSSGVEAAPGVKDHARLRALFAALGAPAEVGQ